MRNNTKILFRRNLSMKRKAISVLLTTAICLSLVACGSTSTSDGTATNDTSTSTEADTSTQTTSSTSSEPLEVVIWDTNQQAGIQQICDDFTAETGIEVQVAVKSWDSYWTLLEAGASGGDMPDVFWMHINESQRYMENDMLLKLDDYIANDESIDLNNYYSGIVDIYSYDGSTYALPKDHDTIAMIYNKTIFDKYGIDYPTDDWTWDDYAQTAAAITEAGKADGVYGTAMNTNDGQDGWYNLIYDFGGKLISDDKKTSGMDDENTIAAMTWLADNLFPSMPDQVNMSETDPDVMFRSGMIGMMFQGSWQVNTFYTADNSSDYAWAMIPYYDKNGNGSCDEGERCSLYNGLGWAASANCSNPDAAYALISALCSEEGQLKQAELGVTMAGYIGASDAFVNAFPGMDITPFLEIENSGTLVLHPASKNTTQWETTFTTELVNAWQNPDTMADVCRSIAVTMNEQLANE
jgi:multiple sugar transport system substrate-binding protein